MALIDNQLFTQTNPAAGDKENVVSHSSQHSNVNNEINSIEDTLVQGYVRESASVSYVSSSSFTVAGDVTAIYTQGRVVRFSDGTTGVVSSSSYSAPNTTVNIISGTVPSTLSYVDIAIQPKGGMGNVVYTHLTQTLENKRVNKRVSSITSSPTPTPDADTTDMFVITALAENATFGAPTGSPTQGQTLIIRIKDNGTARSLSWNAIYRAIGVSLPTTTTASKLLYLGFIYNSTDSKWDCVASMQES